MNEELLKITLYVNATADLCACLESDIKAGNKITSKTVLALSKLIKAAKEVEKLVDFSTVQGKIN